MTAVAPREPSDAPGVHIVTSSTGPERFHDASKPERRGLQVLTTEIAWVVYDVLKLDAATGLFVGRTGRIEGPHEYVVARMVPSSPMRYSLLAIGSKDIPNSRKRVLWR